MCSLLLSAILLYLFLSRQASPPAVAAIFEKAPSDIRKSVLNTRPSIALPTSDQARYVAYYPHGSFHTQRLALENALTLCRILDRTLLLPPLWIGRSPRWWSGAALRYGLGNSSKAALEHCRDAPPGKMPTMCAGHDQWSQVGWDWMVELEMADVNWVDRWDLSDEWLERPIADGGLGITKDEVYRVTEDKLHDVQITDTASEPIKPYTSVRTLVSMSDLPHRLIHFDSLSGSNRLHLDNDPLLNLRQEIKGSIVVSSSLILNTAKKVSRLLGSSYVAIDARVDGVFEKDAGRNMRASWWELGRRLDIKDSDLEDTEREVWGRCPGWRKSVTGDPDGAYPLPPDRLMDDALASARAARDTPNLPTSQAKLQCARLKHSKTASLPFNTPIFITSSTEEQRTNPALRLFYSTYPCLFTLSTTEIAEVVAQETGVNTVNDLDDYVLSPWLRDWVGSEAAVRGVELVGTNGSAWGKWAEEMVQPIAKQ